MIENDERFCFCETCGRGVNDEVLTCVDCEQEIKEHCVSCKNEIVPGDNYKVNEFYDEYLCSKCTNKKKCGYCDEYTDKVRPSPFMSDSETMCKHCWDMTETEYAASQDEHIGAFEDYPHFDSLNELEKE